MLKGSIRRAGVPVAVFLAFLTAVTLRAAQPLAALIDITPHVASLILGIAMWAAGAFALTRVLDVLVWNRVGRGVPGRKAPRLLVQMTNTLIYFAAVIGVMTNVFAFSVTGVVATSSVMGLVIGFAVKSLISDTFSGIALNLDSGFSIGDFIQIVGRGPAGTRLMGQVTEINWRSTYLLTPENAVLVIPNTIMSESMVVNQSRPETSSEFNVRVTLDFEVPVARAVRVLTAAAEAASAENPAVFDVKARIVEAGVTGVVYQIVYMLDPGRLSIGKAKHLVLRHVLNQLTMTGLALAHPKIDNWQREGDAFGEALGDASNRKRLLRQVALFGGLEEEELADLASRMTQRTYGRGQRIIAAEEPGQSMFVISEGLVSVRIRAQDIDIDVASLTPGDFFGEMSLLTGEPRSAAVVAVTDTVAFEIDKDDLAPLLEANPDAAETLSLAAADRRVSSDAARSKGRPEEIEAERASMAGKILAGMAKFFGRRGKPALVASKQGR